MRKLSFVIAFSLSIAGCSGDARERDASAPASHAVATSGPERAAAPAPADSKPAETSVPAATTPDSGPEYREVTIPAGTMLPVELKTSVGSDTSNVEDPVRGTLRRSVVVDGVAALPAGT